MVFRYGAGESRYTETKVHTPEKQFSPVVFFDAPRCILCFRCVRVCNEGMGVGALGVIQRGVVSEIAPNMGDHLECDECGACIDICPVGALTSGTYRYHTRPWEMTHVGTICTHCADGCKTTLGTRNDRIIRGNNRDRSGVNGEFLCIKGRYAFDFYDHPDRLQAPLVRKNGKLEEVSWSEALTTVAHKFTQTLADHGTFGVIGSNHTTNEENFYLQKFARKVLRTNNVDHHRTGDVVTLLDALSAGGGRQTRHCGRPLRAQGIPDARRRPRARASAALQSRFAPTSATIRRTSTPSRRSRCAKTSTPPPWCAAAITNLAPREAAEGTRTGDPVRRLLSRRRHPFAGRFRRVPRHSGFPTSRWWITPIRAAPSTWGSFRSCSPATSRPASPACTSMRCSTVI